MARTLYQYEVMVGTKVYVVQASNRKVAQKKARQLAKKGKK